MPICGKPSSAHANFEKADLREANLSSADLSLADLQDAYLWSTKLAGGVICATLN